MSIESRKNGYISLMQTVCPSAKFTFEENEDGYTLKDVSTSTELRVLSIPDFVTELGVGCCSGITYLESVYLTSSIKRVGVGCFGNCKNLTEVRIPKSLKSFESDLLRYTRASIEYYTDENIANITE